MDDVILISSGSSSPTNKSNNSDFENDNAEIDLTLDENDINKDDDLKIDVDISHKEDSLLNSKLLAKLDELEANNFECKSSSSSSEKNKNKRIYQLSDSEEDDSDKDCPKKQTNKKRVSESEVNMIDLPDCDWLLDKMTKKILPETSQLHIKKPKNLESDNMSKNTNKKQERLLKKAEVAQAKAIKKATVESIKSLKPGECIKYVKALLDVELAHQAYSGELLQAFQAAEMQYSVESQLVPYSVTWKREMPEKHIDDNMEIHTKFTTKNENQIVVIWSWDKILELINKNELLAHIKGILRLYDYEKALTLVIYGIEEYFTYHKNKKRDDKPKRAKKASTNFESVPKVTRQELETAIGQLQVHCKCNVRLFEQPQDIGLLLTQFTKAIAETPFKLEKHRRENESINWFAHGDSKKCVKIDKNSVGLARLWHQQLCQFNLSNLETAEAIAAAYPSPRSLVQAYENCKSIPEAEILLQDIQIRRGAGPLTSVRRIGPEMSKKIHSFFMATEPSALLTDDI